MEFNTLKIFAFAVLILVYFVVRKFFSKVADFTESIGKSSENKEEIEKLNTKISVLEQQVNHKS